MKTAAVIGSVGASAALLVGGTVGMSGCPGPTVPSEPQNPSAVNVVEVPLSWNASPNADGYVIYRGTSSNNEARIATVGEVTSYTDPDAPDVPTLYYQVSAYNEAGEGPRSPEIVVPNP